MLSFCRKHIVAVVAVAAALVSMLFVPPSAAYLDYIDFSTVCCLFSILAVVKALSGIGFFDRLARSFIRTFKNTRSCVFALVFITLLGSMFMTNDMALLTFLPLSYLVLDHVEDSKRLLPWTFILQNTAANLGGMILPFGNPHNLYLFNRFNLSVSELVLTMLPNFVCAVVLIALGCCLVKARPLTIDAKIQVEASCSAADGAAVRMPAENAADSIASVPSTPEAIREAQGKADTSEASTLQAAQRRSNRQPVYLVLFAITLLAALKLAPFQAVFAIVLAVLLIMDRKALAQVDYALLVTFVGFFIFAGNMSSIPAVNSFLAGALQQNALLTEVVTCQFISNLPTTLLCAPFTNDWATLMIATDIGGTGSPIASLASLITLKAFMGYRREDTRSFLALFMVTNFSVLIVLYLVATIALG